MILFGLGAAVSALGADVPPGTPGYDYESIVREYCHTDLDWGPVPAAPEAGAKLLQAQVFIRHGARVTASSDYCWEGADKQGTFECDLSYLVNSVGGGTDNPRTPSFRTVYLPDRNSLPGNCLVGQLVTEGFNMEVRNGQRLREAYIDREKILPASLVDADPEVVKQTIFFRSTDVPRTKQSGMALFSGLYGDVSMGSLPYVVMHTMDFSKENMLVNAKVCPAVQQTQDDYFSTLPNKSVLAALCQELAPKPLSTSDCFWFLQHQVDCLMSRMCPTVPFSPHNTTIPAKYMADGEALFKKVWREVDHAQHGMFHAVAKLGIGPFVGEVLRAAEAAVAGQPVQKLLLYSGHDTGPMEPLWAAFDLRAGPPYWPPFASMLLLELWNTTSGPVMRWVSNGQVISTAPYATFREKARAIVPTSEECAAAPTKHFATYTESIGVVSLPHEVQAPGSSALAMCLLAAASSILTLLAVAGWRALRARAVGQLEDASSFEDDEMGSLSKDS